MRYTTAGESHGRALVTIVTGVPAGVLVDASAIDADLARRQSGYGRGGRQRIETDRAQILSGVRFGRTIGSPVALMVANRDFDNWLDIMACGGDKPEGIRETRPRPGHADLGGILRTDSDDARDILERASARETAARVAAGGIAKAFLAQVGVTVRSWVQSVGEVEADLGGSAPSPESVEASRMRCPDPDATSRMIDAIDQARADGESLGGVFVVAADGLVPGVGTYAEASDRLDAQLAASVMSIPAIKGVEIGDAFENASLPGSMVHDEIVVDPTRTYARATNRAGGVEGGMTNGERLVVRAAMKPIPTLMRPLNTVDIDSGEVADASKERSDVCAVPAAAVVAEAEVAFVLARAYLQSFGTTNMTDIAASLAAYRERIGS